MIEWFFVNEFSSSLEIGFAANVLVLALGSLYNSMKQEDANLTKTIDELLADDDLQAGTKVDEEKLPNLMKRYRNTRKVLWNVGWPISLISAWFFYFILWHVQKDELLSSICVIMLAVIIYAGPALVTLMFVVDRVGYFHVGKVIRDFKATIANNRAVKENSMDSFLSTMRKAFDEFKQEHRD